MEASRTFERIQHLLPQLEQQDSQKSVYLRFMLAPDCSALLAVAQVEETLVVARETVTALPNLPRWFLGLLHSRNQVFSIIDLPQLLGLPAIAAQQCHIVVVRAFRPQEMLLGLRVQRIQGLSARRKPINYRRPSSHYRAPSLLLPELHFPQFRSASPPRSQGDRQRLQSSASV
ncbi:MAG: hypothetical protein HC890_17375 [Chloroflexaceae bacterium]|nr:hypothetical protein [Chloroflexaceae bacterium]